MSDGEEIVAPDRWFCFKNPAREWQVGLWTLWTGHRIMRAPFNHDACNLLIKRQDSWGNLRH
jgi:hypothetical protein